jgi:putative Mn2+ efflux pump MntP
LICALAHGTSTVLIGVILSFIGSELEENISHFTHIIAPIILIVIGLIFIYRHHRHKHFHVDGAIQKKKTKAQ